jgi:hypothetical protein
MSLLRNVRLFGLAAGMVLAFGFAACGEEQQATDCVPGTEIFCRCQGGDAGTRTCLDDGVSRGECMIAPGTPCGERVECEEGETVFCVCPDGTPGEKECLRDGSSFGECTVDGIPCPEEQVEGATTTSNGPGGGMGTGGEGGGSTGSCAHDECDVGDALEEGCSECATDLCAADPYCCDTKWDALCVSKTEQYCNGLCGGGPTMCAHDPCSTGDALESGCDPCVTAVCNADSECCNPNGSFGWDEYCVSAAENGVMNSACDGTCCAHDPCSQGVGLTETCSSCSASVCGADPYCCTNTWDTYCVSAAEQDAACQCP